MSLANSGRLVLHADRRLADHVARLAGERMVFFAGLPGTGKSLLVHQLAHLAADSGRLIHLLQWDIARPVFEASPAGGHYPPADGVTHPLVRRAAGLWVREALAEWNERYREPEHLLIGETPFVGNRFVELARPLDDRAETLLTAPSCRFVLVVPSRDVRRAVEAERERRAASPLHPREREDAPPHVLRDLWRDLAAIAHRLGLTAGEAMAADATVPYDPLVYAKVYERVLRHRNVEILALDAILETARFSAYDLAVAARDLAPSEADAEHFVRAVERRYEELRALDAEVDRWWQT